MNNLIGKLVKVTYKTPAPSGSTREDYIEGRAVKFWKEENRLMVVNPECQTIDDVSGKSNVFKWGSWVDADEATVEEVSE